MILPSFFCKIYLLTLLRTHNSAEFITNQTFALLRTPNTVELNMDDPLLLLRTQYMAAFNMESILPLLRTHNMGDLLTVQIPLQTTRHELKSYGKGFSKTNNLSDKNNFKFSIYVSSDVS